MNRFWDWARNSDTGERVLYFDGVIAEDSWFEDDITPKTFREELFSGEGNVSIWLNSPGGDCIAASQIYSMLLDYKGDVTIKIDGIAASAASVIAMAGTKVLMAPTSLIMIHNPSTSAYGDSREMQRTIEMLDAVKDTIINAYQTKSGRDRKDFSDLMDTVSYFTIQRAMEWGLADGELVDEKRGRPIKSFIFSEQVIANNIMNKIRAKSQAAFQQKPESPPKPEAKAPAQTTIESLSQRLFLISGGNPNV